eukprot:757023-Prymnesium_polylepis.1
MHRCAIRTPLRRRQAHQPCSDERRGTLRGGSGESRRTGGGQTRRASSQGHAFLFTVSVCNLFVW